MKLTCFAIAQNSYKGTLCCGKLRCYDIQKTKNERNKPMNSEQAKTYTQEEVDLMIAKAIKQDREFLAQVLRALPLGDTETKQGWIENPKSLAAIQSQLCPPKENKKAPKVPQHLYEFTIRKTGATAVESCERLNETCFISDEAKAIMDKPEYMLGHVEESVLIRVYRAEALVVKDWSETTFFGYKGWEHLKRFGLGKCLPDDSLCIREAHHKQKLDEWISVAHDPFYTGGYNRVFRVGNDCLYGICLCADGLCSTRKLSAGSLIAVRVVNQSLAI